MRDHLGPALLCITLGAAVAPAAQAQRREVYQGTSEYRPGAVPPAHQAVVRRDVGPVARALWARVESCRDELRAIDFAAGSFTGPGAPQRAVLYRFCQTGPDAGRSGVAVLQAGRVVAHVAIENLHPDGLRPLPDVDRDGAWELMLVDDAVRGGEATTHVHILQLVPGGVRTLGTTRVRGDAPSRRRLDPRVAATILYVTPARRPVWEAEVYYSGETADRFRDITPLHRIALARDRATYRRVR